jgi:hypothetical protein
MDYSLCPSLGDLTCTQRTRTDRGQQMDGPKLLSYHPEALRDFAIYTDGP